ncbi:MAG: methyl-accepting chemotaxis protein [Nitrospiraceae bacterium]|jgi:methyl-accepting chemotaxis protein|nr:methyl-accepting chemotaxis protein [Nitrospiraceae bacterium]
MASDMKIKTRLILGFGIVILLAVGIGLSSYVAISALSNDVQDLGKRRLPQIIILGDLTENILVATTHLQKAFLVDNRADLDKAIESMLKTRKGITDAFDKLKVLVQTEKGKALYQAMVDARKPNADMRNQIVKALQEGNKKEAVLLLEKYEPLQAAYLKSVENMVEYYRQVSMQAAEDAEASAIRNRWIIIAASIINIVLSLFVVLWIIRSITRPLHEAVETANRIAAGDLTVQLQEGGTSETGQLLSAMKTMVDKLKGVIVDIREASAQVAAGSERLSASSEEISRTMHDQTNRSSQIATAAEEMSQTVIDIAKNASSIAQSSADTSAIAHKGSTIVSQSVAETKTVAETVNKSAVVMQTLGEKSTQIGEIVAVINDIADQTNLLALNAAIEAARAGEQGRGFAVVADEVRKLAERTAKATAEISQMIGAIQGEVDNAVNAMNQTNKQVDVGLRYSVEAGEQLESIVSSVSSLQNMIQQIASATEEMSSTSEAISGDIQAVAGGAREISTGAEDIAHASSELAHLSAKLKSIVDRFKV